MKGLTSLQNHLAELKGVHNIDCYEPAADLIISHIIFNNLQGSVKNELMNECKTLYPNLTQIFENIDKVVEKVNTISGNVFNRGKDHLTQEKSKLNNQSPNSESKSNNSDSEDKNPKVFKVFSMNSIHQKPIKPENVECTFCEGNHWSSKCTQVVS